MKKSLLLALCFFSLMLFSGFLQKREAPEFIPNELLVKYKPALRAADVDSALSKIRAEKIRKIGKLNVFRITLAKETAMETVLAALKGDTGVEFVEPNYVYQLRAIPNDPRFNELWGLHNTGQTGGSADADVDAPEAWDLTAGSPGVIVAVTDTGVDYHHPDLRDNMWKNSAEVPGDGIDNDGNGYPDDVYGYDFIENDSDPMDYHNHGTHVAGTIGAVGGNHIGVTGVNQKTRIMALKIFKPLECGGMRIGDITTAADSAEAIIYAVDNRAKVINASWGGRSDSLVIKSAIAAAHLGGVLFVAAAGNDGANNDATPHYPSNHGMELPNVIAVAATDHSDNLASFSNYGPASVHLGAPGVEILSTVRNNGYGKFQGTSMASPHVAGTAALVWAMHPSLTHLQVKECILRKVDPKPALTNKVKTNGRLNAFQAVRCNPIAQTLSDRPASASIDSPRPPAFSESTARLALQDRYHRSKIGIYYVLLLMPLGFIAGWKFTLRGKK